MVGEEVDSPTGLWARLGVSSLRMIEMSSLLIFPILITGRFWRQKVATVVMSAEIAGLWGCMYVTLQGRWSWHLGAGDRRSELS